MPLHTLTRAVRAIFRPTGRHRAPAAPAPPLTGTGEHEPQTDTDTLVLAVGQLRAALRKEGVL